MKLNFDCRATLAIGTFLLALLAATTPLSSHAATFDEYTIKADWLAAANPPILTEDFEDLILNAGLSITSGGGTISGGVFNDDLLDGSRTTTFHFATPVTAAAGDLFDLDPGGLGDGIRVTVFFDGGGSVEAPGPITTNGFYGFVTDTPVSSVLLEDFGGARERYSVDDLLYSTVPEPSTAVLSLAGLLMGTSLLRRKRV